MPQHMQAAILEHTFEQGVAMSADADHEVIDSPAALFRHLYEEHGVSEARRPVATFAIDGEVRFASAADRAAFAEELASAVAGLVARYHTPAASEGRDHRLVVALHPNVTPETKEP